MADYRCGFDRYYYKGEPIIAESDLFKILKEEKMSKDKWYQELNKYEIARLKANQTTYANMTTWKQEAFDRMDTEDIVVFTREGTWRAAKDVVVQDDLQPASITYRLRNDWKRPIVLTERQKGYNQALDEALRRFTTRSCRERLEDMKIKGE
ncbi:MAG: hypothetical protein DRI61_06585 [Chloroflexi bacterium]|nr:MAG: hypothetical protein DRI61_06585 [Chloroflexota bacterium]